MISVFRLSDFQISGSAISSRKNNHVLSSLDVILLNRPEAQEQIKALSAQGKTIREISAETGIPKSTVQRLKKNV